MTADDGTAAAGGHRQSDAQRDMRTRSATCIGDHDDAPWQGGTALRILASPYRETAEGNPIQALLYDAMEKAGARVSSFSRRRLLRESWDVWHLHWPLEYVVHGTDASSVMRRLATFALALKAARFRKTRIFWTVHNIRPHEQEHPQLERLFWRIFLPCLDGIICMSEAGKRELLRAHPQTQSVPTFTIPHGHYRGAYPDTVNKEEARAALGIPERRFVALFIGQIRPYKGVVELIRCFADARLADAELLVAGMAEEGMAQALMEAAAAAPNVRLALAFIPRDELQIYLRAADLVILPFTEILNSASALLALSFDRPILVPAQGALPELHQIVGPEWMRLYHGPLSSKIVRDAVEWAASCSTSRGLRAPLDCLGWDAIGRLTLKAFAAVAR